MCVRERERERGRERERVCIWENYDEVCVRVCFRGLRGGVYVSDMKKENSNQLTLRRQKSKKVQKEERQKKFGQKRRKGRDHCHFVP